jgi:hypothetical protein
MDAGSSAIEVEWTLSRMLKKERFAMDYDVE